MRKTFLIVLVVLAASSVLADMGHPASQLLAGTFSGNFVFNGNVTMANLNSSGVPNSVVMAAGGNSTFWNGRSTAGACAAGWLVTGTTVNGVVCSQVPGGSGQWTAGSGYLNYTGNVGVNTTTPRSAVDVAGQTYITGSINKKPTNPPLFRWLPEGSWTTFNTTENSMWGIAFDGTNMWTADYNNNSVSKISPTGIMTIYKVTGKLPQGIAFDGSNMWTANSGNASVTKIAPNGSATQYLGTGSSPEAIAFDGVNMWTANFGNNSVTKVTPSGSMTTYQGTGSHPLGIAFDGTNMWTVNQGNNSVTKITPSGSMTTYSSPSLNAPNCIAFDGTNMWTADWTTKNITRIAPDGSMTVYIGPVSNTEALAFDGTNIWAIEDGSYNITKISPTGAMTTYGLPFYPNGIAFDGTFMWVTSGSAITKVLAVRG